MSIDIIDNLHPKSAYKRKYYLFNLALVLWAAGGVFGLVYSAVMFGMSLQEAAVEGVRWKSELESFIFAACVVIGFCCLPYIIYPLIKLAWHAIKSMRPQEFEAEYARLLQVEAQAMSDLYRPFTQGMWEK